MERDTIEEYFKSKIVKVETYTEGRGSQIYAGEISGYDHDFITLSPFVYFPKATSSEEANKMALGNLVDEMEKDNISKKTLGRRTIDSIEEIRESIDEIIESKE